MFRWQAIDRNNHIQLYQSTPLDRDDAEGAGHDLAVYAPLFHLWQEEIKFTISDQRITADKRDVERAMFRTDRTFS